MCKNQTLVFQSKKRNSHTCFSHIEKADDLIFIMHASLCLRGELTARVKRFGRDYTLGMWATVESWDIEYDPCITYNLMKAFAESVSINDFV